MTNQTLRQETVEVKVQNIDECYWPISLKPIRAWEPTGAVLTPDDNEINKEIILMKYYYISDHKFKIDISFMFSIC